MPLNRLPNNFSKMQKQNFCDFSAGAKKYVFSEFFICPYIYSLKSPKKAKKRHFSVFAVFATFGVRWPVFSYSLFWQSVSQDFQIALKLFVFKISTFQILQHLNHILFRLRKTSALKIINSNDTYLDSSFKG